MSNDDAIRNTDLRALRNYVTAPDTSQRVHADTLLLDLTHSNLQQRHIEIRFDRRNNTLQDLYHTYHQKTGSAPTDCILQVYDCHNMNTQAQQLPAYDSPDAHRRPLGYYFSTTTSTSTAGTTRIHCIDTNPHSISARGQLENVALVPKYVMSEADYDQRPGTLRAWSKAQRAQDPHFSLARHAAKHAARRRGAGQRQEENDKTVDDNNVVDDFSKTSVAHCHVGDRCQLRMGQRRGRVAWVGAIPAPADNNKFDNNKNDDYWVGVVLDEPVGHNDGTFAKTTQRYFEAQPKYGVYCRGKNVETGDFPERDIFDEEDSSSEDEL